MASNFRISVYRNSDTLHLKLYGNFDGDSALQLVEKVKKNTFGLPRVVIHTGNLKVIQPFGRHMLEKNLFEPNRSPFQLLFTGENANRIAPENSLIL